MQLKNNIRRYTIFIKENVYFKTFILKNQHNFFFLIGSLKSFNKRIKNDLTTYNILSDLFHKITYNVFFFREREYIQ